MTASPVRPVRESSSISLAGAIVRYPMGNESVSIALANVGVETYRRFAESKMTRPLWVAIETDSLSTNLTLAPVGQNYLSVFMAIRKSRPEYFAL
jgi:hypothetical protein